MRQLTLLSLYVSLSKSNPKFYIIGSNNIWSRIYISFFRRFQEAFLIFATLQMSTVSKSATWNLRSKKNNIRFHKDLDSIVLNSTLATMWKSRYLSCGEPIFDQQQSNDTSRIKAKYLTLGVFYVQHLGFFQRDLINTYHILIIQQRHKRKEIKLYIIQVSIR